MSIRPYDLMRAIYSKTRAILFFTLLKNANNCGRIILENNFEEVRMNNRPTGRRKNISGQGKGIRRRGEGLGTGPVGRPAGYDARRPENQSTASGAGSTGGIGGVGGYGEPVTRGFGGKGLIAVIVVVLLVLVGGGGGLSSLFGGGGTQGYTQENGWGIASEASTSGWTKDSNNGRLNKSVAAGARAKRTKIVGNGSDTVTIMVYMCGTDLESKSGMASSDLMEMTKATLSDKVNLLVYTGGCTNWKNDIVSSSVNQIYKVESGGVRCLVKDDGKDAMTKPATLTRFIKYASSNYPANRNMLILWDHGGGSITGYGYDEKNLASGSMDLGGIDKALSTAGVTFDFIGFDACLMATYETALTLDPYADYLIASEETEPGIGWYYTNWLTHLSTNTSMATLDIGKEIADDFVKTCGSSCPGQKATLSVVDIAELSKTTPDTFKSFAAEAATLCQSDDYQKVSDARAGSRSFAISAKKDMVDLAHLGYNIGTSDSVAMADSIVEAVKYNKTSSDMSNSYGLSIYFPYQKISGVDSAVKAYEAIGLDSNYSKCIRSFASLEVAGQATGGSSSPLSSLLGSFTGQSPLSSGGVSDLFGSLLSGDLSSMDGLSSLSGLTSFFGRDINEEDAVSYITDHQFDSSALKWTTSGHKNVISLPEEQWAMVHDLELNVFYDDGEGFINLGFDNVFDFTDDGDLIGAYDGTWLAIDEQPVPYFHESTVKADGATVISGYIPILLNGDRAELLIVFDNANPDGYITGVRPVYAEGETETVAKSVTELTAGDKIEFVCDYYTYAGEYQDSYVIADMTYTGGHKISNVYIDAEHAVATYVFTDIYNLQHWTETIPN